MGLKFSQLDKARLQQLIREQPQLVDRVLRETAVEIVQEIQLSFNSSPPGRTYKRTKTTKSLGRDKQGRFKTTKTSSTVTHVASQPGYPPNIDTGRLRASIRFRKTSEGIRVEDGTDYEVHLELGTSRMKARPFMRPAFDGARQRVIQKLRDGLA